MSILKLVSEEKNEIRQDGTLLDHRWGKKGVEAQLLKETLFTLAHKDLNQESIDGGQPYKLSFLRNRIWSTESNALEESV